MLGNKKEQIIYQYQYSWKFLPNNARSHWLLRGHMTSNNETVSRQSFWAGKIEKSMTSEGNRACPGTSHLSGYCLTIQPKHFQRSCIPSHFPLRMMSSNNLLLPRQFHDMNAFLGVILKKKRLTNNNRRSPSTAFVYSCQLEPVNRLSCLHQSLELSSNFLTSSSAK